MDLKELTKWFKQEGYILEKGGAGYGVRGNGLRGVIWYNPFESRSDDRQICLDRADCYDKPQKCPITLPLPATPAQLAFLKEKIDWLKTPDGYKASDEYEYEHWVDAYPDAVLDRTIAQKFDPAVLHKLTATILSEHGLKLPATLSDTYFCTWKGVGDLMAFMAVNAWHTEVCYIPTSILWTVNFARPLNQLKDGERTVKVEAVATTRRLDDVPVLVALAAVCTRNSINVEGLAKTYGFQVDYDHQSVQIRID